MLREMLIHQRINTMCYMIYHAAGIYPATQSPHQNKKGMNKIYQDL